MCTQSVRCAPAGRAGSYGTPGPVHVTAGEPSPASQLTDAGTAVTVADKPVTPTVTVRVPHDDGSSHHQVANPVTAGDGLNRTAGAGSGRNRYACSAST